ILLVRQADTTNGSILGRQAKASTSVAFLRLMSEDVWAINKDTAQALRIDQHLGAPQSLEYRNIPRDPSERSL
ncbi:hypothetical protein, partial [Rubellimicrobium roseum]|uniref:hypothetical protein n=1 Tax=Rubellimicrobium roseum TaxID=687525 RepID=UPI001C3F3BC4